MNSTPMPTNGLSPETTHRGAGNGREAEIQFFEGGKPVRSQNVGIRIHGGATRSYSQKSFNVYARSDYGAPKLEYDLFSGKVKNDTDGSPVTVFDSFILRNGGNDAYFTRFSDKLIQSLVSDRQFLTQGMEPCIVFVDGEFWGHYEITEKMDADFISAHCGVPAKDICIIKKEALDDGSEETFAEWEKLRKWIQDTDFSVQANYDELCERIDMQGFMDYVSTEIYINNHDWGKPNAAFWKAETADGSSPYADGKWRFILFDTEYSSGLYGEASPYENSFERFMDSDCFLADLFNGALENEGFRRQFRETFMDIADNNFNTERVTAEIDRLAEEYRSMVIATYDRFWSGWTGGTAAEMNYDYAVDSLRSFYEQRYEFITKDLDAVTG
ncbi:CotH kinase family protein [Ruminococcus sp.]|uniref:CotH kinase family protein n=2 Tax=Ruminococcus sp. TaxID=41978 RepID=UPI002CFC6751|nr:CotH kinase family protein [Ruminococcus sp.]HOH86272.1 CotH kinase family protein [Ruminococcus sp.]